MGSSFAKSIFSISVCGGGGEGEPAAVCGMRGPHVLVCGDLVLGICSAKPRGLLDLWLFCLAGMQCLTVSSSPRPTPTTPSPVSQTLQHTHYLLTLHTYTHARDPLETASYPLDPWPSPWHFIAPSFLPSPPHPPTQSTFAPRWRSRSLGWVPSCTSVTLSTFSMAS